jgi:hypothetical protein
MLIALHMQRRWYFIVSALLIGLHCMPATANDANVPCASDEETIAAVNRHVLPAIASAYNLQVLFNDQDGIDLHNTTFVISTAKGREIYSGVNEGPLLYLKLPSGQYQIAAKLNGEWQRKLVRITPTAPARLLFVAKNA